MSQTELEKKNVLRLSNEESHKLTKECIQTALIDIMTKKPFNQITVSEVITRSGISRSAFYRNYSSKEDVIKEICCEAFSSLKALALSANAQGDTYSFFYGIFTAVRKHEKSIRLLMQVNMSQILPESVSLISVAEMLWPSAAPEDRYRNSALEGACNRILYDWFQNGMKESEAYMAKFCNDLTKRI